MATFKVVAKEWFDRKNGNSYFAARVFLGENVYMFLPFQYGSGSQYLAETKKLFKGLDVVIEDGGIETDCLKRDVKAWGLEDHLPTVQRLQRPHGRLDEWLDGILNRS
jgi:hypothetical protein